MAITTIKIPVDLRDRISSGAKARGITAAALLTEVLDDWERRQRMESVGQVFADLAPADDYWVEVRAWDAIGSGLPE